MQKALSAQATAERSAAAKLIEAKADVQAAHLMRDAAEALNTPAALQIRELKTLKYIAGRPNTRTVFVSMSVVTGRHHQSSLASDTIDGHRQEQAAAMSTMTAAAMMSMAGADQ